MCTCVHESVCMCFVRTCKCACFICVCLCVRLRAYVYMCTCMCGHVCVFLHHLFQLKCCGLGKLQNPSWCLDVRTTSKGTWVEGGHRESEQDDRASSHHLHTPFYSHFAPALLMTLAHSSGLNSSALNIAAKSA